MHWSLAAVLSVAFLLLLTLPVHSVVNYANDFIDPKIILSKNYNNTTFKAQATIVTWADDLAAQGPWSVVNKPFPPPSGDKHDYLSRAPYLWPDCSKVGNTTELTPEQIWDTCPYYTRDGKFNPDVRDIDDIGAFDHMANAVLFNSLAWVINGSSVYAANAAEFVKTWFIDADTAMNPNLEFAQMHRGPDGQNGTHTGILDLKCMTKVVSGVLLLREGKAVEWTSELDAQLTEWTNAYIGWLNSAAIALEEKAAPNNHGTFYFNQLAALQVLAGDTDGARKTLEDYFTHQYKSQITVNGDQPLETARTRPYHYRAYNLAAMITNAKIGTYIGYDVWHLPTDAGTTIQDALDYALTLPPGNEAPAELWPDVVAVGAVYGDPAGTYAAFMRAHAGSAYPADAQFFYNQPFSDSGLIAAGAVGDDDSGNNSNNNASAVRQNENGASGGARAGGALLGVAAAGVVGVAAALLLGA